MNTLPITSSPNTSIRLHVLESLSGSALRNLLADVATRKTGNEESGIQTLVRFFHHPTDARPRDTVFLCHLGEGHAGVTISDDLLTVDIKPRTPDLTTFKPCPAYTRLHTFDDDAAFEFRHRAHDDDDRPTKWSFRVYGFALRQELNALWSKKSRVRLKSKVTIIVSGIQACS
jgi:hypothetical protein